MKDRSKKADSEPSYRKGSESYATTLSENSDGSGCVPASGKFVSSPGQHQQCIQCRMDVWLL